MDAAAEQFADVEAYVEGSRRLTFSDWLRRADGVAAAHGRARRAGPGTSWPSCFLRRSTMPSPSAGAIRAGAVATGLNVRLGPREVKAIADRCQPTLAVVPAGAPPAGLPASPWTPWTSRARRRPAPGRGSAPAGRRGRPGDPAVIVWTSGTTGLPKGAWFDHDNLRAAVTSAGVMTAPFDRRLVSTPFAHAGYMVKLWEQLAWATTVVISPTPWRAADMLRLLGRGSASRSPEGRPPNGRSCSNSRASTRRTCAPCVWAWPPPRRTPRTGEAGGRALRMPPGRPLCHDRVPVDHRDRSRRSARGALPDRRAGPRPGWRSRSGPRRGPRCPPARSGGSTSGAAASCGATGASRD